MKNYTKKSLKDSNGITLIALVITIIVLLILAGISISMLSGDNGILQKATDAKTQTEKSQIIENAQIDILAQQTNNKGSNITKEQLANILNKYFKSIESTAIPDEVSSTSDVELTTTDEKYTINLSKIFKGNFSAENNVVTFGEKYQDSMIGKMIDYKSEKNNVNEWIIIGKQVNKQGKNDIMITTKNPVSSHQLDFTLVGWTRYEKELNDACKTYIGEKGTLGIKNAIIKEVRNINLDDINKSVDFTIPETFDEFTFREGNNDFDNKQVNYYYPNENEESPAWVSPEGNNIWKCLNNSYCYYNDNGTYKYSSQKVHWNDVELSLESNLKKSENMKYILANNTSYLVASRTIRVLNSYVNYSVAGVANGYVDGNYDYLCTSDAEGGHDISDGYSVACRPIVVLSSEILWDDVKDLIGNYATYN